MSPNVEPIGEPVDLGEGPFWNAQQQTLYYVDILGASIHSYNAVTKEHHSVKLGNYDTEVNLFFNSMLHHFHGLYLSNRR